MKIYERNAQEIGNSLLVSLPKEWTRGLTIKKGTPLKVMIAEQGNLLIAPEFVQKEEQKESIIGYDAHFQRRFFREYFNGNDKIIVNFKKRLVGEEREQFSDFLQRFMNVQIVEETNLRCVLKCFKIDELSIEECLKRMHFLTLNIFETSEKAAIQELRNTITRFYYMLVMQIRRFLAEGKFTKENQIPLIKALDYRMVAEKVQRIATLLARLDERGEYGTDIKNYYATAFGCFISDNYEKALSLWEEGFHKLQSIEKSLKKAKSINEYKNLYAVSRLLMYSREISMLIR